ncbi:RRM domain-containing protein, partial [Durusdinium trenchii]
PTPNFKGLSKLAEAPPPPPMPSQESPSRSTELQRAVDSGGSPPPPQFGSWETVPALRNPSCRRVKVYNLMKSVRPRDVKSLFEKYVGPIEGDCNVSDCVGTIHFVSAEHAQMAVEKYNGGILEMSTERRKGEEEHITLTATPWGQDAAHLRGSIEELLWPLADSQLRRGDGWLTLFRVSKAKEAKRTEQQESHQVDYKGSILTVRLEEAVPDQEGIVIQGGPMVL